MTDHKGEASSINEYDEILRKLEELMRKHRQKTSGPRRSETKLSSTGALPGTNIPTLTEIVDIAPSKLSPQSDIKALLEHILDSALKDAGARLDPNARTALVQSLQSHLFGI